MCLITAMGVLSACSSKKDADTVNDAKSDSFIDPQWIIGPTIDAESIEPLVRADYNESTRHYDISYADCFKIKKSGKYGIIDYNGKIVVSPEYDSIVAFGDMLIQTARRSFRSAMMLLRVTALSAARTPHMSAMTDM